MMTPIKEEWIPEAIQFSVDPDSGSVVEQLTSDAVTSMNIYNEQRFASADGNRIAISRKPFGRPNEIWICDLRSFNLTKAVVGEPLGATSPKNAVYYISVEEGNNRLMLLDLAECSYKELYNFKDNLPRVGAVSPDMKYFVGGPFLVRDNIYSLQRVDLTTGEVKVLCELEDMFNPHIQFGASGTQFNIQINRGGRRPNTGERSRLVGPLGATIAVGDVITGEVTMLPIGKPVTPPISGHAAVIGETGAILFSAAYYKVSKSAFVTLNETIPETGEPIPEPALYSAAPGDKEATLVSSGILFNHLAVSDDGKYFIADDHKTGYVYIGRIDNGKYLKLCESQTRQGKCQYSHVHPYMTPDQKYVIYNSIVTGCAQVYAASIPEGFLESI